MGAWGYGHLDNDSALDFISFIFNMKPITKLAKKKKLDRAMDYDEVRAACEVCIKLSKLGYLHLDIEVVDGLTNHLDFILKDKEWLNGWDNPQAVKKNIRSLLKKMRDLEGY